MILGSNRGGNFHEVMMEWIHFIQNLYFSFLPIRGYEMKPTNYHYILLHSIKKYPKNGT